MVLAHGSRLCQKRGMCAALRLAPRLDSRRWNRNTFQRLSPVGDNLFSQAEGGSMLTRSLAASIVLVAQLACVLYAQTPAPQRPLQEPMKPLYVLEDSYVGWRILPS